MALAPDDRYKTAGALADDLRRQLEHLPVLAHRYGPVTRTSLWARRSPATATAIAVALVAFASFSCWLAQRSSWQVAGARGHYRAAVVIARSVDRTVDSSKQWLASEKELEAARDSLVPGSAESVARAILDRVRSVLRLETTKQLAARINAAVTTVKAELEKAERCNREHEQAMLLLNEHRTVEALKHLRTALLAQPDRLDIGRRAILVAHDSGTMSTFAEQIDVARTRHPDDLFIRLQHIHCLAHFARHAEALEIAESILRDHPRNAKALHWKSVIILVGDRPNIKDCVNLLSNAHLLDPGDPDIVWSLIHATWASGDRVSFHSLIDEAMEIHARNNDFHNPSYLANLPLYFYHLMGQGKFAQIGQFVTDAPEHVKQYAFGPASSIARVSRCLEKIDAGREEQWPRLKNSDRIALAVAWHSRKRHAEAARLFEELMSSPQLSGELNVYEPLPIYSLIAAGTSHRDPKSTGDERRRWRTKAYEVSNQLLLDFTSALERPTTAAPASNIFLILTGIEHAPEMEKVRESTHLLDLEAQEQENWSSFWRREKALADVARRRLISLH
ncbi:hypothetical protein V5E97_25055 [Singulisphaera sp. Ch08]|uniref:Tetratricopeptide repeat protein n=1 Tax=Singulisphaera sp. Ch08 TaxID=3120278 RepID=A0AAU7CA41_9BACT